MAGAGARAEKNKNFGSATLKFKSALTLIKGAYPPVPKEGLFQYKTVPPRHRAATAPTAGCIFSSNAPSLVLHATS